MEARYYVTKITDCPYCVGKDFKIHNPNCSCKDGKVESRATFEEALDHSSMGKDFKILMNNMERMMDVITQSVLANFAIAISPHKKTERH